MESIQTSLTQPSHSFGAIYANDQSIVHLGDVHNHVTKTLSRPQQDEISKFGLCLGSAPQIDREYFIGRVSEINAISKILQPGSLSIEQRRVVLGGIGGAGKTQIAIAYARCYRTSYDSVFWLNATTETSLKAGFRLVAQTISEELEAEKLTDHQVLQRVHKWLCDMRNTQWLLIFDNYDDPDTFDLDDYCPLTSHGDIIITSRLSDLVSGKEIRVQPLSSIDESLAILQTRSGRNYTKTDPAAYRLAERFAGLPLALATAGAFLRRSTFSYERYLHEYIERWNLDEKRPLKLLEYRERTLYTTWNQSYARLESDDRDAASILRLLAYFDNQSIWFELLTTANSYMLTDQLPEALLDPVSFESTMRVLLEYGFVEMNTDTRSYSMHNCIHDWTLGELNKTVNTQQYWYAFDCIRADLNAQGLDLCVFASSPELVPHAIRLTHHRFRSDEILFNISSDRIMAGAMIGIWLLSQHECAAAEQVLKGVIERNEEALERGDYRNVTDLGILGAMYASQGELDRAKLMYDWALEKSKIAGEPDRYDYFLWVRELSFATYLRGDVCKAEGMFLFLLKLYDNTFGPDSVQSMVTFERLIQVYDTQGNDEAATALASQVVHKYDKIVNEELGLDNVHDYAHLLYKSMRVLKKDRGLSLAHFLRLMSFLKEKPHRTPILFMCVGRALLFWQDWANAELAYRYSHFIDLFESTEAKDSRLDLFECDGCDRELDVELGLNVCTQCADVDLCDDCLTKYRSGTLMPRKCVAHDFYSIDTSSSAGFEDEEFEQEVNLWIREVIDTYTIIQSND